MVGGRLLSRETLCDSREEFDLVARADFGISVKTVVSIFGIEPSRIGGVEAYARELSTQLGERGWKSVLCFLKPPPDSVRGYLQLPNVRIEVIEDSWRTSFRAVRGLRRILKQYQPEILHLHFTGFIGPYPWLARLSSVDQVLFTDHSSHPEGFVSSRAPFWKRALARMVNLPLTRVVTVSKYGYQCAAARDLIPFERLEMIYNSADLSRSTGSKTKSELFRAKHSIPKERVVVTQVSWIIPEKGIGDLLAAARAVVTNNPNVHFVFVGEGAHRAMFARQAAELGIKDHVTWTGQVDDPLNEGVYAAANIVCQVSRWEEVFGYVIAEAMACGKPLIGTRVGGIPELVRDGETGFVVRRGDTEAIAARILELASDSQLRRQMGRAGRRVVEQNFDLERNVARVLQLYGVSTPLDLNILSENLVTV
jgi:glycosyltransferase involved in cell wall biosynthesis